MRFQIPFGVLGFLALTLLMGCGKDGWFRDRSEDYLYAKSYPMLKVPSNIHAEPFSKEYEISSK